MLGASHSPTYILTNVTNVLMNFYCQIVIVTNCYRLFLACIFRYIIKFYNSYKISTSVLEEVVLAATNIITKITFVSSFLR